MLLLFLNNTSTMSASTQATDSTGPAAENTLAPSGGPVNKNTLPPNVAPPTPEATPDPEQARIEADKKRRADELAELAAKRAAEVATEAKRILDCSEDSYAEILGVNPNCPEKELVEALRKLGCLLHVNSTDDSDAKRAFDKLLKAAESLEMNDLYIAEIRTWDGEEGFNPFDEDMEKPPREDKVPDPPEFVKNLYIEATDSIKALATNSEDPTAKEKLEEINGKITDFNKEEKAKEKAKDPEGKKADQISDYRWTIRIGWFGPQFKDLLDCFHTLQNDPTNGEALKRMAYVQDLINEEYEKKHFPQEWKPPTFEEYLVTSRHKTLEDIKEAVSNGRTMANTLSKSMIDITDKAAGLSADMKAAVASAEHDVNSQVAKIKSAINDAENHARRASQVNDISEATQLIETAQAAICEAGQAIKIAEQVLKNISGIVNKATSAVVGPKSGIAYPWATPKLQDGSFIIGARSFGPFTQVCVEEKVNGRFIRKLVSENDVSLDVKANMKSNENWTLNLAKDQAKWGKKHASDFKKLLWVATTPDGGRGNVDCCVEFENDGVQVLTKTSFFNVITKKRGTAMILDWYQELDITAPITQNGLSVETQRRVLDRLDPRASNQSRHQTQEPSLGGDSVEEDRNSETVAGMEKEVNDMKKKVNDLETKMNDLETNIEKKFETKMKEMETNIETEMKSMEAKVDNGMKSMETKFEAGMNDLGKKLDQLLARLNK
ncbi:hypothetical protein BGZ63DRAFT_379546 [Mariannaea sp. PMI_226]|nr:hypothetical protein BGZ63DRAFT_379546 [Mariannaea sp. PMI_226]